MEYYDLIEALNYYGLDLSYSTKYRDHEDGVSYKLMVVISIKEGDNLIFERDYFVYDAPDKIILKGVLKEYNHRKLMKIISKNADEIIKAILKWPLDQISE